MADTLVLEAALFGCIFYVHGIPYVYDHSRIADVDHFHVYRINSSDAAFADEIRAFLPLKSMDKLAYVLQYPGFYRRLRSGHGLECIMHFHVQNQQTRFEPGEVVDPKQTEVLESFLDSMEANRAWWDRVYARDKEEDALLAEMNKLQL